MATKKTTTKKTPARKATAKKAAPKKASTTEPAVKKTPKPAAAKAETGAKKLSAIDAAAKVLAEAKEAMTCTEMIEAMAAKKLWSSPGGKTPKATLYSAILREIKNKGKAARFTKTQRGKFAASG